MYVEQRTRSSTSTHSSFLDPVVPPLLAAAPLGTVVKTGERPLLPCTTVMLRGLALVEKSVCSPTVRATWVVCVADAPVPVTVIGYVPGAVLVPTLTVNVEDCPALIGL